jgi:hypothetical protein
MARTPAVGGGRPVVVTIRLSREEAALFDRARGGMSRGVFGRIALLRASHPSSPPPQDPSAL